MERRIHINFIGYTEAEDGEVRGARGSVLAEKEPFEKQMIQDRELYNDIFIYTFMLMFIITTTTTNYIIYLIK